MHPAFARRLAALLVMPFVLVACSDDDPSGPSTTRVFVQTERLGNPLVSEVFFAKRDHGLHNTTAPATDVANAFGAKIKAFTDAFARGDVIGNTLVAVLVPDMLIVYPNRSGASAGWLSWALANGYGGRKLQDDVVDAGLTAIFGNLLDPNASVVAGLTSDNVPMSTRTFSATFPYLETPR